MQSFGLARLGRDAETRFLSTGDAVASLSLAFNYGRKGEDGKRPTQWVDGALWGKLAEALSPYLLKGTLVAVTLDDVRIETYPKSDGSQGVKLAGRVSAIELAGGGEREATPQQRAPAPSQQRTSLAASGSPAKTLDQMDDDIPF